MCIAAMVIAGSYFDYKKRALRFESRGNRPNTKEWKEMKKKIEFLLDENQDLKEEVEQMKFLLGVGKEDSKSLDIERYQKRNENLTEYEKEQIRIDNQNKFKY